MEYIIIAEFRVIEHEIEAFRTLVQRHVELSRAELGCRTFEVCQDVADPAHFVFYEAYVDEPAYVSHRATSHYQLWREAAALMTVAHGSDPFLRRSVLRRVS